MIRKALVVVNFRVDHTPLVLTGETREMQEQGTPAKCFSKSMGLLLIATAPFFNSKEACYSDKLPIE